MNRCQTCRYWLPPLAWESVRHGECQRVQHLSDNGDSEDPPTAPITVTDIEGVHTRVRTSPDFGCSLWEKVS